MQEAVVDSLGICTVLEGCRKLTKIAFNQLDMADSVFERMARQTTQLQVRHLYSTLRLSHTEAFSYRVNTFVLQALFATGPSA